MRLKNKDGFTLIELMVVVALIGILAAIAVPNIMAWLPNMRLKATARDLYSNMQKARLLAVKFNKNTAIIFDTANNKYDICDDWDSTASPPACIGTRSTLVNFNNLKSGIGYGHGNSLKQANSGGSPWPLSPDDNVSYSLGTMPNLVSNTVIFTTRGLCKPAGYVYLDHKDHTTTYAIGSQTSGIIKIMRWTGSTWK